MLIHNASSNFSNASNFNPHQHESRASAAGLPKQHYKFWLSLQILFEVTHCPGNTRRWTQWTCLLGDSACIVAYSISSRTARQAQNVDPVPLEYWATRTYTIFGGLCLWCHLLKLQPARKAQKERIFPALCFAIKCEQVDQKYLPNHITGHCGNHILNYFAQLKSLHLEINLIITGGSSQYLSYVSFFIASLTKFF